MLASDKLIDAFNQQIGNEMGASMQYIAIASYFDSETLPQLAKFFYRQSEEERTHAMRFVKFINDVGGKVRVPAPRRCSGPTTTISPATRTSTTS